MKTPSTPKRSPQQSSSSLTGRVLKSTLLTLVALTVGSVAQAATLEFDTSTAAGYQGGTSLWDSSTTSVWTASAVGDNPSVLSTWNAGTGTDAVFASTLASAATLTVNSNISANSILIQNAIGVTLSAGTGAITLGSGGALTISGTGLATVNNGVLTGSGGLVLDSTTGGSTVYAQDYTGQVQLLNGLFNTAAVGNFGVASTLGKGSVGTSVLLGTVGSSTNKGGIWVTVGGSLSTNRTFIIGTCTASLL